MDRVEQQQGSSRMSDRKVKPEELRSRQWFNNPDDAEMTALYTERYLNYGLTREELRDGRPIIALAQTGSDLSPCNRHHLELAKRVRDGIIAAGGLPIEIPVHPIQETGKRPTAMLDRNLAYLSLVETLYGYPIDGVVLMIGCDKTTPALLMAAATVDIPAIALSVGPMLNGWHEGKRTGSGTIIWKARQMIAALLDCPNAIFGNRRNHVTNMRCKHCIFPHEPRLGNMRLVRNPSWSAAPDLPSDSQSKKQCRNLVKAETLK